jgi:subtilisin family serine protease
MYRFLSALTAFIFLASCGGGGGGGDTAPTPPITPAPIVNLSADPVSVLLNNSSTLTWSSSNATSCSADWTSSTAAQGTQSVTISASGNTTFSITCSGAGGNNNASVSVEGYRNSEGIVVDGYITGAEVCIDEDDSWTCDSGENTTTSDNDGKFTIKYANGNLISIGGTDLDSQTLLDNLLITHKLTGHSDFKAVTPVTSIAAFMEDASLVNSALGIDASIDVFTFDPVANKGDGGINDYLYEKGNQLTVLAFALQNITNNLNTTTETTQDYLRAITEEIEKEYTETETKVDIETEAFVTKVFDNVITAKSVTIDETAKVNTAKSLAGVMPIIAVKSENDLTTAVIRFAISTLQTDIQAIANGTATAEIVTSYTEDVINYIAEDQNIDANKIIPNITAIADNVTTQEDTAITIDVLANDSYLTTASINISFDSGSNGTTAFNESSRKIIYTPSSHFNGEDIFSYTITQGDKTSSADVTVTIEAVNDLPNIDIASTIQVDENQTAVTTVTVSDADSDELTLTMSGTDADSFNLSSEYVLSFKAAPDFETKSSYFINFNATDGIDTETKEVTININNLNDNPPIFDISNNLYIEENIKTITTIIANDADGDPLVYSLKDNSGDNDKLTITPDGVLSFITPADYETRILYTASIAVTDGVFSDEIIVIINVTDANDNDPEIITTGFSIYENQSLVGVIEAKDIDTNTVFSYAISGMDSDKLIVDKNGLVIFSGLEPDYEKKSSYLITITVSDGLNETSKEMTLQISNILEDIISRSFSISNGTEIEAPIIDITLQLDELSDAKKVYALLYSENTSGQSCGSIKVFELTNSSDINWTLSEELEENIQQVCKYNVDYYFNFYDIETESVPPSPGVHLSYGNARLLSNKQYSTRFRGKKEDAITIKNIRSKNVIETFTYNNQDYGWYLYSPSEEYPSECNTESYIFPLERISTPVIAVPELSCTMAMIKNSSEDSEKITYDFYIYSKDKADVHKALLYMPKKSIDSNNNGRSNSFEVEAAVSSIDENDPRIARFVFTVDKVAASRQNSNVISIDTYTKSMLYRNQAIEATSPIVELNDNKPPEIVSAEFSNYTDSSKPQRDFIKIDFKTLNEAGDTGVITSLRDLWVNARGPDCSNKFFYLRDDYDGKIDTSLTNISATFPLLKSELGIYQIESININDYGFAESNYYGLNEKSDREFNALIGSSFIAGDGSSASCPLFLTYPDFDTLTIDENDQIVGNYTAQGSESDSIIYSLTGDITLPSDDERSIITDKLQINSSSGEVTYIDPPDYDKLTDLDSGWFGVRAFSSKNPSLYRQINRVIVLNNLNDNFPEIISTQMSGDENQNIIGCIIHADKDINVEANFSCLKDPNLNTTYSGDITFEITGDNILVDRDNGALRFIKAPDYEQITSYTATITINDGENSTTADINIKINDLNDNPPVLASATSYSVKENQSSGGLLQISDPDTVNEFTYSIDETYEDGAMFTINSNGELIFVSNPDYEEKNSYKIKVIINDGVFEITEDISISLEDVVAEAIPTNSYLNLLPKDSNQTTVQLKSSVLEGRTATYSIEVEPFYGTASLDSATGVINYTTDYSDVAVETITFRVNDGVIDDGVADLTLNLNSDPAYKESWHLDNTGQSTYSSRSGTPGEDINADKTISSGHTGEGIGIHIMDSGMEIAHEDLIDNVIPGYSVDFIEGDNDPTNPSTSGDHGTSVAGLIAAKGWNNVGSRGVAPDASIIGNNILQYFTYENEASAWGYEDIYTSQMDIFNMSYGLRLYYDGNTTFNFPKFNSVGEITLLALKNGVTNLRNGKGAIYIKSLGNGFRDNRTNGFACGEAGVDDDGALGCTIRFSDSIHNTPYILGVGALKATGIKTSYSTTDPSIWISGFAGEFGYTEEYLGEGYIEHAYEPAVITTDQTGCYAGYVGGRFPRNKFNDWGGYLHPVHPDNNNCNYTSTFNGTSAAAPTVAGGVAVLLGAYPDLTWRDVKHIMASTARKIDPDRQYYRNLLLQYDWITNAAGYSHHYWYGFGAYDLGAAMDFAATYTPDSLGAFNEYGWKESESKETFFVTVEANSNGVGNVYVIDNVQKKSLSLNVGTTYTFSYPSEHPLRFSTTSDGTHAGGSEYEDGVTKSTGVTTIKVNEETPSTLYYYCDIHSGMGSDITRIDEEQNLNLLVRSYKSSSDRITYTTDTINDFVEYVQIKIYLDKDIPRDIGFHLISPDGTEMSILHPFTNVSGNPEGDWFMMGVTGFYGEKINGDWTLKVTDYTDNEDNGILIDWGINVFGN